jgi:hypothetical protein
MSEVPSPWYYEASEAFPLEPCPCCGPGNSRVCAHYSEFHQRWQVTCGACGLSSGVVPRKENDDPHVAQANWNRRHPFAFKSIEGAPRDGSEFIGFGIRHGDYGYTQDEHTWTGGKWDGERFIETKPAPRYSTGFTFTHWMPINLPVVEAPKKPKRVKESRK